MADVPRETVAAPAFDFDGLTPAQQELLTFQGWAPGPGARKQPRPAVAQELVRRGLATVRQVQIGAALVPAYDVPIAVHAAWCSWCAQRRGKRA